MSLKGENPYTAVEILINPLFEKLSLLSNVSHRRHKHSPRSKSQNAILNAIMQFFSEIDAACTVLIRESPDLSVAVETALDDISNTGQIFQNKVQNFTDDPTNPQICDNLRVSGTAFLSSLTRLLILANLSEKSHLVCIIKTLLDNIENILSSATSKQLSHSSQLFRANATRLINLLNKNTYDSQRLDLREQNASLKYFLRHNTRLLLTAAKVHLNHPEINSALLLRDNVAKAIYDELYEFRSTLDGSRKVKDVVSRFSDQLFHAISDFENNILLGLGDSLTGNASPSFPESLRNQIEELIHAAYKISDSPDTDQRERSAIHESCNRLRDAVTQIVNDPLHRAIDINQAQERVQAVLKITGGLKDQLQRAAVGHAVQALVVNDQPLMSLSDATKFGDESMMKSSVERFQNYTNSLITAAHEVASFSSNEKVSKGMLLAGVHLQQLCPQLVQAAELLFLHPNSKSIETNYETFKTAYQETSGQMYTALKELINLHDFLAAADMHMKNDFDLSMTAVSEKDDAMLQRHSTTMQHRASLVSSVVNAKMGPMVANREYVANVMNKVTLLKDEHSPNFVTVARVSVSRLAARQPLNAQVIGEAGESLCFALHSLRMAALREETALPSEMLHLRRQSTSGGGHTTVDDHDWHSESGVRDQAGAGSGVGPTDIELEETVTNAFAFLGTEGGSLSAVSFTSHHRDLGSRSSLPAAVSQQEDAQFRKEAAAHLALTGPEEEQMHQELAGFLHEKRQFMKEVNKWDDSGNEIVVLAKKMCLIMMDMTDYTRGKGQLHSTGDVIQAAREISDLGRRLDQLSGAITEVCPDCSSRRDLIAYRQRIMLHCHQLDITSRVKAGMSTSITEGVENATALIHAARNLMNAVILTMKESYLISTKYPSVDRNQPAMPWRMQAPSKKLLVNADSDSTLEADLVDPDDRYRVPQGGSQSIRSMSKKSDGSTIYKSRRPRDSDFMTELSKFDRLAMP